MGFQGKGISSSLGRRPPTLYLIDGCIHERYKSQTDVHTHTTLHRWMHAPTPTLTDGCIRLHLTLQMDAHSDGCSHVHVHCDYTSPLTHVAHAQAPTHLP